MKRQSQFGDANMMSPYAANQMQQVPVQRMQQAPGLSSYPGHMGSFMREDDRSYASSANADDQWQWDRDTQQMSPHLYREEQGQGNNENRSFYQNQMSSANQGQDMGVVREKTSSLQTFEGLEKQFSDDIMKMMKEQMDAEDAENARHREKILEINNQYQEKLVTLRARYAARREEVLKKESQGRLQQYHLAMRQYQNNSMGGVDMTHHGGYSSSGGGSPFPSEVQAQRPLGGRGGHFNSQRQRRGPPESYGRGRGQALDLRGPPSAGGGGFNNPGPRYY